MRRGQCHQDAERLAPSRRPGAGARWSPFHLCRGFCFVAFPFCSVGTGWQCRGVAPTGLGGAEVGHPIPRAKAQTGRQRGRLLGWSGRCHPWWGRTTGTRCGSAPQEPSPLQHRVPHAERASSVVGGLGSSSRQTASRAMLLLSVLGFFCLLLLLVFFYVKPVIPLAPLTRLHLVSAQLLPLPHQPSSLSSGCFTKQHTFHRTAVVEKANGAGSRPDSIMLSWAPAAGWEGF